MPTKRSSDPFADLIQATHLAVPNDIPKLIIDNAKKLKTQNSALYLVDYEQRVLAPVPNPHGPNREKMLIDTTLANWCYQTIEIQVTLNEEKSTRIWVPVLDNVEQLSVLEVVFDAPDPDLDAITTFADVVAKMVMTKHAYSDLFERVQRRQPMSVAAELA